MNKFLEAAMESTEAVADAFTKSEIAKNIPVVGTAIKLIEGTLDLRDRLFASKIQGFIEEIESVSADDRERFKVRLARDQASLLKVGETAILVIEKLNDIEKAKLLGFYFSCLLRDELDSHQFRRIANAIDICFVDDMNRFLKDSECPERSQESHMESLYPSGMSILAGGKSYGNVGETFFDTSSMGRAMHELWHRYKQAN